MSPIKVRFIKMGGRNLPFALTQKGLFAAEQEFQINIVSPGATFFEDLGDPDKPGAAYRLAALIFAGTRGKSSPSADWIIERLDTLEAEDIGEAIQDFFRPLIEAATAAVQSQGATSTLSSGGLTNGDSPASTSA